MSLTLSGVYNNVSDVKEAPHTAVLTPHCGALFLDHTQRPRRGYARLTHELVLHY